MERLLLLRKDLDDVEFRKEIKDCYEKFDYEV